MRNSFNAFINMGSILPHDFRVVKSFFVDSSQWSVSQWLVVSEWLVAGKFVLWYNTSTLFERVLKMIYKELTVWKKSMELVKEVYMLTKKLPKEETYGLSDQMRRAAVSIPSNIAEGNGRKNDTEYARFLNIARGSECELETQLYICVMLNYLTEGETKEALYLLDEVGRMLNKMLSNFKTRTVANKSANN